MDLRDNKKLIQDFFNFINPIPFETYFSQEQVRNNDMKITLQIATRSNLRMQSDPKQNKISFSCKVHGKNCFQIFGTKQNNLFVVQSDYEDLKHRKRCELLNQQYEYLKIYNLMKLKKNLIQTYMINKNLMNSSPSEILADISQNDEYFFEKCINYNCELRRKLRKRFDNIINIDIKKITKGGRQTINQPFQQINLNRFKQQKQKKEVQKQKLPIRKVKDNQKKQNMLYQLEETSIYNINKNIKEQKAKKIIKKQKKPKSRKIYFFKDAKMQKTAQCKQKQQYVHRMSQQNLKEEVYFNPASQSQLQQIKQLNSGFNMQNIFNWESDDLYQPVFAQTINDKLRQNVFMSLRSSLLKRSLETRSIQNFPDQMIGFVNDPEENEQDQIV